MFPYKHIHIHIVHPMDVFTTKEQEALYESFMIWSKETGQTIYEIHTSFLVWFNQVKQIHQYNYTYIIPIPINFGNFMYIFYLHELYFYYIFLTDCFYLFYSDVVIFCPEYF